MTGKSAPKSPKRHRIQLDLSSEALERLERLRDQADASTNAELVRRALKVYECVEQKHREGKRLCFLDEATQTYTMTEFLF